MESLLGNDRNPAKSKKVLCPGLQLGMSVQAGARSLCHIPRAAQGPAVFPLFSLLAKHLLLWRVTVLTLSWQLEM